MANRSGVLQHPRLAAGLPDGHRGRLVRPSHRAAVDHIHDGDGPTGGLHGGPRRRGDQPRPAVPRGPAPDLDRLLAGLTPSGICDRRCPSGSSRPPVIRPTWARAIDSLDPTGAWDQAPDVAVGFGGHVDDSRVLLELETKAS